MDPKKCKMTFTITGVPVHHTKGSMLVDMVVCADFVQPRRRYGLVSLYQRRQEGDADARSDHRESHQHARVPQVMTNTPNSSGTKASTWYTIEYDFRQLCGDAVSQAKSEKDQTFSNEMLKKANRYGLDTFISGPQLEWLCRIADHAMPKKTL